MSGLAKDISEFLAGANLPKRDGHGLTVAYHAAFSLQHGQKASVPVVHVAELLDWATGGPKPAALEAPASDAK